MPIPDRKRFFDLVRGPLFGGRLTQDQVTGMNTLLNFWQHGVVSVSRVPTPDIRWLAYVLATVWHETDQTMQPVAETGRGAGHAYGEPDPQTGQCYYGRGYVQLTWRHNYACQAKALDLDLVHMPNLALIPIYAASIAFEGMIAGDFTGHGLAKYFSPTCNDPVGARHIINGTDCADKIADAYQHFLTALTAPPAAPSPAVSA